MSLAESRIHAIEAQYVRARRWLLFLVAVGFIVNGMLYWYASEERPGPALMEFTRAVTRGETALCPGDTLRYDITLYVSGPGVFDLDVTTWRITPPATVMFSSTRRLVFSGPVTYSLGRAWIVPDFYSSAVDGSPERWAAGSYERRHAITTTSRSTEPSIVTIPFQVRADCE